VEEELGSLNFFSDWADIYYFLYQKAWLHKHKKWSRSVLQMIYWASCLLKSRSYFLETDETFTTVKWKNQEFLTATTIYFIEAKHGK